MLCKQLFIAVNILCNQNTYILISHVIKTHCRVSATKKAMWRTSVLFTGTANLLFSTPRISITTGPISIKFTYFMPSIYATLIPNLKEIGPVVYKICVPENCPIFFTFFFFFTPFYKSNIEPTKDTLLMNGFLSNLAHL